jgi:signal transduction histidine kinase
VEVEVEVAMIRRPRRTVRMRLTALYCLLFVLSSIALLTIAAITNLGQGPVPVQQSLPEHSEISRYLRSSVIALGEMTVVSVAAGWLVAGRVLRPLRVMTATTRRISADNLHERLAFRGPGDELKDLADTVDALLGRLDGAFAAQRRFVANASHELRTPLTLTRALIEAALSDPAATAGTFRSACQEVLAAGEQQEHLIEALLTLARSQRGLSHHDPVDLHDIATDVLRALEPEAATWRVTVDDGISPASLLGDARLIERLVSNLIQNGLRYNMPGGVVQVTTGMRGRRAFLAVANTGPVVAAEDIGRLLQPFQRLHTGRTSQHDGHGLGLSIIAAIARAHDARLSVRPAAGGGLDIGITFPAAPAGHDQALGH